MKTNEAGPLFRVLSFIVALLMWLICGSMFMSVNENDSEKYQYWELLIGMLSCAVSFSYVAITGYIPKVFLILLTLGHPIRDDKDLK